MTREQKIEALSKEYERDDTRVKRGPANSFKQGMLAGIRLRDEELLAMEFDEDKTLSECFKGQIPIHALNTWTWEMFRDGARWQYEQFIKAIKGDGDV
jgi:hypothetical protein